MLQDLRCLLKAQEQGSVRAHECAKSTAHAGCLFDLWIFSR